MGFLDNKIDLPDGENLAPDPKRVSTIQDMLIPGFRHLGRPGSDRSAWEPVKASPIGQRRTHDFVRAAHLFSDSM